MTSRAKDVEGAANAASSAHFNDFAPELVGSSLGALGPLSSDDLPGEQGD